MSESPLSGQGFRPAVTLQEALGDARRVALTAHVDPDPDGLGCALGLAHVLWREGWEAMPVCIGRTPVFATELPGAERLVEFPSRLRKSARLQPVLHPGDALVVVDTPTLSRLAGFYDLHEPMLSQVRIVSIDHHITNDGFGAVNFVDVSAAASAEVVCDILEASGLALNSSAATCLMAALIADTQGFRTESTSPRSLLLAHRLWNAGAPLYPVARMVFATRSLPGFRLWGAALGIVQSEDGVAWTTVTESMLADSQATMEETEGLVDFLLACREVRVALLLKEQGSETRVSVRTLPGVDATQIVGVFGGGGHQRAAGCTLACGPAEAARRLLPVVRSEVNGVHREGRRRRRAVNLAGNTLTLKDVITSEGS